MAGLAVPMIIVVALMSAGSGAINYGEIRRTVADEASSDRGPDRLLQLHAS